MSPPAVADTSAQSTRRGIFLFFAGTFVFATLDTLSKHMTGDHHPVQITWGRLIFAVLVLFIALPRREFPHLLRARRIDLQAARAMLTTVVSLTFVTAVAVMPLSDATAIAFTTPLFVTALAALFLGERVGVRRWSAVVVGFVGVVIVVRPDAGGVQAVAFLVLGLAFANALFQILTRVLATIDSPHTTMFYTVAFSALGTSAVVPFFWTPPTLLGWCELVAQGLLTGLGQYLMIQAICSAKVSTLAPFAYFQIIWVTVLAFVTLGEIPAWSTVLGAAVIVGSGVYTFYRETYLRKHPKPSST